MGDNSAGPRCVALVGPYLSGKTTLLESLLFVSGATGRRGTVKEGNTVGDSSPEARARQMSTELSVASYQYLEDPWTVLDAPGSIEVVQDAFNAVLVADAAVVVVDPDPGKAMAATPIFKFLDDHAIPHMVFINKIDEAAEVDINAVVSALRDCSERPLVLRHVPIREGGEVTGYIDLASERAYTYKDGEASERIDIPDSARADEEQARQDMLESLADYDDTLLEALLEDQTPSNEDIYQYLTNTLQADEVIPVFIGAGLHDHGVRRLLKALRHETPGAAESAKRAGFEGLGEPAAQVLKTYHMPHAGKQSVVRIWSGEIADGTTLNGTRVSGIVRLQGHESEKISKARAGEVVAFGRMEPVVTGEVLTPSGTRPSGVPDWPDPVTPLYAFSITAEKREDEVKLSGAIAKLIEEDPSLRLEQSRDTNELLIWGQGEIHLAIALERLQSKYHLAVARRRPQVAYKETIKKTVQQHARFKRQTGGHGQFGDVHVEIKPQRRGSGFEFIDNVVGGAVPRQFIPSVETGIKEYLTEGPLGFPVVDVAVRLYDGQHHAVDSSDMAFKTAGRMAMSEGMPKCAPVLLEPIYHVKVSVPNDFTAAVQRIVSGRRGQILGFDAREGWKGWDTVEANMPQSEVHDLIIELRSQTQGIGTFDFEFDHLQELTGRIADDVVQSRQADAAQ
ncbi:MAG TPA: elongation factor G [Alphaproteobacteria bacterium]|nr:elongation factor G [Alphaproteobacteria bacterium]